ncbi:hypothetical protein M426DRAFT_222252 [Hypoxylon sp. CI-4A]|nr:hypothetical protein M426DRAFT_222252 [Hypoxylon sp. CI-4A]
MIRHISKKSPIRLLASLPLPTTTTTTTISNSNSLQLFSCGICMTGPHLTGRLRRSDRLALTSEMTFHGCEQGCEE